MRVERLITSGSSLEISNTPLPLFASSSMRPWISALAPTSTPRVGSSTINTRQSAAYRLDAGCPDMKNVEIFLGNPPLYRGAHPSQARESLQGGQGCVFPC